MKYLKRILLIILLLMPITVFAQDKVNVYLFHSEVCTHCQAEIEYLNEIKDEYNLEFHFYQVYQDQENMDIMNNVKEKMGIESQYVPFVIIGSDYYIGFSEGTKDAIVNSIKEYDGNDIVEKILNGEDIKEVTSEQGSVTTLKTFLGDINLATLSLPVIAVVIGTIDGFNPCAMWILIFLISMLFNMKNKKKMWILGITFLLTSALVYLLFMLAWLKVATTALTIMWIRILIAIVALTGGITNIKSYINSIKKDAGCEVVDNKKRKKIFKFIKKIVSEKSFVLAMLGIMVLAFSVNLIELACSAGLPLVFTQILAANDLTNLQYWIYILIYIFFFLIDDIIVFVVAMVTLNVTGISTKYTKYSHLVGGIIMILISLLMIFKPSWLMFNI